MGLLGHYVAYRIGKSQGKRLEKNSRPDTRDPDCINYSSFCETYGSCDGQRCEYQEIVDSDAHHYDDRSDRI